MGVPVTFLSADTKADTAANLVTALGSESGYWLVIPWDEVKTAINSNAATPNSLEDWLSAIVFTLIDKVTADTDGLGRKLTASRRFSVAYNGRGTNSTFETGTDLATYQASVLLYTPDVNPSRPPASDL